MRRGRRGAVQGMRRAPSPAEVRQEGWVQRTGQWGCRRWRRRTPPPRAWFPPGGSLDFSRHGHRLPRESIPSVKVAASDRCLKTQGTCPPFCAHILLWDPQEFVTPDVSALSPLNSRILWPLFLLGGHPVWPQAGVTWTSHPHCEQGQSCPKAVPAVPSAVPLTALPPTITGVPP